MNLARARVLGALACGALFGAGLVVSEMTRPVKVLGFLDVLGNWDPSLVFVMVGAIAVHALGNRLVRRRERPLADTRFAVPPEGGADARLLLGAGIFGVGWGLTGYCPGPAVVSLASGSLAVLVFVASLLAGNRLAARVAPPRERSSARDERRVHFSSEGGGAAP